MENVKINAECSFYHEVVKDLKETFKTGKTLPYSFRIQQLKNLLAMIENHEEEIVSALQKDLRRPAFESLMYDTMSTKIDITGALKDLHKWMKPVYTGLNALLPFDTAFMKSEPFGVALIIGTWNYPIVLIIKPLVGAIAAGNCAVIKPSEISPCSAAIISKLIPRYLDSSCYRVIEGSIPETTLLLTEHFDFIFATCSIKVGQVIMTAAAKNLTPVALELGGKSPAFIDDSADLDMAVKRTIWGKFINAGQTCIAPDYIICSKKIEEQFLILANKYMAKFYGNEFQSSPSLSKIVNINHFNRLKGVLDRTEGKIAIGGKCDESDLWFPPTFVVNVTEKDSLMQDEIFGPILPFITADSAAAAFEFIQSRPGKPLALYIFAKKRSVINLFTEKSTSGSMCINDVIVQFAMPGLSFGGVGTSGIGRYVGKASFECFSHKKSVLHRDFSWIGELMNSIRYPPYGRMEIVAFTYFFFRIFHWFYIPSLRLPHIFMFLLGGILSYFVFAFRL